MMRDCQRTAEVAATFASGAWLEVEAGELRKHASSCPACADLVLVMSAMREARDGARRTAAVPSAGLVWWKAQLRKRREAARRAEAPVAAVQFISLVVVLAVAGFALWMAGVLVGGAGFDLATLTAWFTAPAALATGASSLVRYTLILGATASLILGPVALYLVLRKE